MSALTLLSVLLLTACAPIGPGSGGGKVGVAKSDLERATDPGASADQVAAVVDGNTAFGFDLYAALREQEGDLFLSPYSISLALAMTYAGARGETAEEMAQTLHFTLPQEQLHPAFNALDLVVRGAGEEPESDASSEMEGDPFVLHVANSLWGERTYEFQDPFLDTLARDYGAGLRLVDFAQAPEEARQAINGWVEEQTEERIKDLIPEGAINTLTRLVLANAIYFKAAWSYPFNEGLTKDAPFQQLDGSQVDVPMMTWTQPERASYAAGDGYQIVALPYEGGSAEMLLIVPDQGQFAAVEAALDADWLDGALDALQMEPLMLTMPRFETESEIGLADTLKALGMPAAFDPNRADFSGMDGTTELYISDVFHKAFVNVDEEGTEAAAATAVVVAVESAMPAESVVELTVDRPFIFLIREQESGAVLFLGRVVDPS
jgi:serpin B